MPKTIRRIMPTRGDIGVVGLATLVPFLTGAVPTSDMDLHGMLIMAVITAASAAGGVVGKGLVVLTWNLVRSKGRAMKKDADKGNDWIGDALEDTSDRMDPEGAKPDDEEKS